MKCKLKKRARLLKADNRGVSLVELLVVTLLVSIVLAAGSMVFTAEQNAFSMTTVAADLQENCRRGLQRISFELQESGRDQNGAMKVTISDGAGANSTDVLKFSVPICVCGTSPIDEDGNVSHWGAPLKWGEAGCVTSYTLNAQGKVDICHLPPGNPTNTQNLSVNVNAVKAHLAHGDYIGSCNACNPSVYTNRSVEYRVDGSGRLLRRVLDNSNNVVRSDIVSQYISDFQAVLNGGQTAVTITMGLTGQASLKRTLSLTNSAVVILRNR